MPAGMGYGGEPPIGIPQAGAVPGDLGGLDALLTALTSGQMSPEQLLMLLALLSGGAGMPTQVPQPQGPPGASPLAAALGGAGMPAPMSGGPPEGDLMALLGGLGGMPGR